MCAYPFPAVDTARTSERLTAFLSEYIEEVPVDQYFGDYRTIDWFYKKKKMIDGGAQLAFPIGKGSSPNNAWARGYDTVGSAGTNNSYNVVYDFANIFDASVIAWDEMREIAGSDHRVFDRVAYKRDVVQNTTLMNLNAAYYAATQSVDKTTTFVTAIDSTGACGSLSATTVAQWASRERAHGAAYTADGYGTILQLLQDIKDIKGKTTVMFTTNAIERAVEKEFNVDVRYSDSPDTLKRGASKLLIKNIPIVADADCTAQTIYFADDMTNKLYVDTEGDMQWFPFESLPNQFVYQAKFVWRGQQVITDRRGQGKVTTVS